MIRQLINKAAKNKIIWYVLTRYITYAVQFLVSLFCAVKLGPYYFGVWGFVLLLLNYLQQVNFFICSPTNILLVQFKDDKEAFARVESTAFISQSVLSLLVLFFAAGNLFIGYSFLNKYPIGLLFYIVCLTAMFNYMVQICTTIYRVKHSLIEIAIAQSIIPFLALFALCFFKGYELLCWFTISYLCANFFSFLLYLFRGKISLKCAPSKKYLIKIIKKGWFLFIYNGCLHLIIITTRTVVSSSYPVEQFGYFTFAFTLADAVILLLGAISFLLFPKAIEKLHTDDVAQVKSIINTLRVNYITLTHSLMYFAFLVFPLITYLLPKYLPALPAIYMVAIALLLFTLSSGYLEYLMAQNKDKNIATIALISLIINIGVALFLAEILMVSYEYVIVSTIISYFILNSLFIYLGMNLMNNRFSYRKLINECLPYRLFVPIIASFVIVVFKIVWIIPIPLVIFMLLNYKNIKEVYNTVRRVLFNPNIMDVSCV